MGMTAGAAAPIAENEQVKELLALMQTNSLPGAKDLLAVIGQVSAMENHLAKMVNELAAMRRELAEAQRQNHPLKAAMQKTVIAMQAHALDVRDRLAALKGNIVDGCKGALSAVREGGLSALRHAAAFFPLRPALRAVQATLERGIRHDEAALAKIEAASAEYHKAGLHVKNMGRAMRGKAAIQHARPMGALAKAFAAPIRADRACNMAMRACAGKALAGLARLEKAQRKPPVMETIQQFNEQIAQAQKAAPAAERPRPAAHER